MLTTHLIETSKFAILASDAQIERTMRALETNNIHVIVAENGADAKFSTGQNSCRAKTTK